MLMVESSSVQMTKIADNKCTGAVKVMASRIANSCIAEQRGLPVCICSPELVHKLKITERLQLRPLVGFPPYSRLLLRRGHLGSTTEASGPGTKFQRRLPAVEMLRIDDQGWPVSWLY